MPTHTPTAFGALVRRYRLAAGLSQEALAERAGLSVAAISALESGRRTAPRPETISLIADALGLAPPERRELIATTVPWEPRAAEAPSPPPHPSPSAGTLPATVGPLIGREREEAAVAHLLVKEGSSRLVTLTGPGGVGKTRLALAVAAAVALAYADGVAFVDLAPVRDPEAVAPALAEALGLREDGARDARDLLLASLETRRLLLVLDNVEQVVEAAPLLADLVVRCPHLALLVTSRIALQVRAEQRFALAPLAVPIGGQPTVPELESYAAVQLFMARAQAVQPECRLTAANATAVAELCRRLDGLPLALELAAAWVVLLPPTELLRRLEQRLSMLTGGARDLPARQQTLRAAIDWSYDLLTATEQTLFARLSVFAGGGTLDEIAAICDPDDALDVLGTIESLVDKSLLRAEGRPEPRIGMLETLREYARERLEAAGEMERWQRAHALYYLALAEAAEPQLRGADQAMWLRRLADEHDNLRAALQWALRQGEVAPGWRLGGALWRFWYLHGHIGEGRRWLTRLLALTTEEQPADLALARATVLGGAGVFAELQGDYAQARAWHEECLALRQQYGDRWGVADALSDLGVLADSQGEVARASALYEESLALFRDLDDAWGMALVLSNQGYLAREQGADAVAITLYEQSLALFRQVGDQRTIAFTLNNLGEALCDRGDYERAQSLCEESLARRRALGDAWGMAISIASLGRVAQAQGTYTEARARYEESLALFRAQGATWNTACTLDSLSAVACLQGAYDEAAELSAESLTLFRSIQDAKGSARALTTAARVAYARGDLALAERHCHESLALYRERGPLFSVVQCLECLAQVLCTRQGEGASVAAERVEWGVQLWSALTALRDSQGTQRLAGEYAAYERSLTTAREALDTAAFTAAWERGAGRSLEQVMELAGSPVA